MYDEIADVYHLVYEDWEKAVRRQSSSIAGALETVLGAGPHRILDVSCGIGTQALGLAGLGHEVTASDLSAGAVRRARREASSRGLSLKVEVADMRECQRVHGTGFDAVISCDNSFAHLQGESTATALRGMRGCLRDGGVALIGIRDYRPDEERSEDQVWTYGTRHEGEDRYVVFQTRDWNGDSYEAGMYFVREARGGQSAAVISGHSMLHAIEVDVLAGLMQEARFGNVRRDDKLLHPPVLLGIR